MVSVSVETPREVDARLRKVIQQSRFDVLQGTWAFEEFPLDAFSDNANSDALALVRDETMWSQLVPSDRADMELFTLFAFHFPAGADNSGFVGWLASHLKNKFGTGVFVTCGQNSNDGGIFDYWGCPAELGPSVIQEVERLVTGAKQ